MLKPLKLKSKSNQNLTLFDLNPLVKWPEGLDRNQTLSGLNPLVKWPGGKRRVAHRFADYYDRQLRYVSLFAGGLGDLMKIRPERVLANDNWKPIVNLFNQVKIGLTPHFLMVSTPSLYNEKRNEFNLRAIAQCEQSAETACLLYFLLHTGYNGLVRCRRDGAFNVSHGKPDKKKWHLYAEDFSDYRTYLTDFSDYQNAFANWEFTAGDFESVPIAQDDFIYADPPYDPISATGDTFSYAAPFTWGDQVRLAEFLAEKVNPVVASNYATPRILELYSDLGFTITTFENKVYISANGADRAKPVIEMLAFKNIDIGGDLNT